MTTEANLKTLSALAVMELQFVLGCGIVRTTRGGGGEASGAGHLLANSKVLEDGSHGDDDDDDDGSDKEGSGADVDR